MRYRGGAEAWIQVEARARIWRFPGHTALLDVMRVVWGEVPRRSEELGAGNDA